MFTSREVLPDVFQITDALDVNMTLLCGTRRAVLVDTGYGVEDLSEYVKTLTSKSIQVILTHCHHDHALGACLFPETYMNEADFPYFERYTGVNTDMRRFVRQQAFEREIGVPEDFLTRQIAVPKSLSENTIDLGGLIVKIYHRPGHTPGSVVLEVPERDLILTGDNWNPCTWLFFPEALPIQTLRKEMLDFLGLPFKYILCPHQPNLYDRKIYEEYWTSLTDRRLENAEKVNMGAMADTREVNLPGDMKLVFDWNKYVSSQT